VTTFRKYVAYHVRRATVKERVILIHRPAQLAANNRRRKDLFTLHQTDRELLEKLGYKEKLDQVDKAILVNEQFLNKIVVDPEIFGGDNEGGDVQDDDEGNQEGDSKQSNGEFHRSSSPFFSEVFTLLVANERGH
jgi:carnosine N-methyltransferase